MDAVRKENVPFGQGKRPFVAAVSGVKNSGKTTFLSKLIPVLKEQGMKVAVIKHDGHEFVPDVEGTDSYRLKAAGAYGCAVFSRNRWMVVKDEPDMDEQTLIRAFPEADIILLEGLKDSSYPKFEIIRGAVSQKSVCRQSTLLGVVTDTDLSFAGVPVLGLEDVQTCAKLLIAEMKKQAEAGL